MEGAAAFMVHLEREVCDRSKRAGERDALRSSGKSVRKTRHIYDTLSGSALEDVLKYNTEFHVDFENVEISM